MLRRSRWLVAGLVVALLSIVGNASPGSAQTSSPSTVTIIHGIQGVPVDVYVDGALTVPNFQPKAVAGPLSLPAKTYRVQIFPRRFNPPATAPATGAVIAADLPVPSGKNLTVVAHPSSNSSGAGSPTLSVFENNLTPNGPAGARLSVRHTADAPAVDVANGDAVVLANIVNGSGKDIGLPGNTTLQASVRVAGTTTVAIGPLSLVAQSNKLTNVYAISALDGSQLDVVVQQIPLQLAPPTPTGTVYVVHGILGVTVDVYVNGGLLLGGFQPRAIAGPLELVPGDYRIQIYPRSSSNGAATAPASGSVIDTTVALAAGANVSLTAQVNASGAPVLTAFANDVSAIEVGRTRLSIRHAANAPATDIRTAETGAALFSGLTSGSAGAATIPALSTRAYVALAGATAPVPGLDTVSAVDFPAGRLTAVYAISSLDGSTFDLVVQPITLDRGARVITADGGQYALGNARFVSPRNGAGVVAAVATPDGAGYWTVTAQGVVAASGSAGSVSGAPAAPIPGLKAPIVDIVATPTGNGLYLVASDGGVFAYGDAVFRGSAGALPLTKPVVGASITPSGLGYWLVASDGGVFAYGDAGFYGSTGAIVLNQPIVGLAAGPGGQGYWLVASDGGVFAFGSSDFYGSLGSIRLNAPIVDISPMPSGRGYRMLGADGGIFNFGAASTTITPATPLPVTARAVSLLG
jgi:hypothetical protein